MVLLLRSILLREDSEESNRRKNAKKKPSGSPVFDTYPGLLMKIAQYNRQLRAVGVAFF